MKFRIATGDADGRATPWFAGFMAYAEWDDETLQCNLDKYDSHASVDELMKIGDDIEFENEHYATLFILKWSR
jgi:hypothetical protein